MQGSGGVELEAELEADEETLAVALKVEVLDGTVSDGVAEPVA